MASLDDAKQSEAKPGAQAILDPLAIFITPL